MMLRSLEKIWRILINHKYLTAMMVTWISVPLCYKILELSLEIRQCKTLEIK